MSDKVYQLSFPGEPEIRNQIRVEAQGVTFFVGFRETGAEGWIIRVVSRNHAFTTVPYRTLREAMTQIAVML